MVSEIGSPPLTACADSHLVMADSAPPSRLSTCGTHLFLTRPFRIVF